MSEGCWMMARRVAFLVIIALAVFMAGSGATVIGVGVLPKDAGSYEAQYGIVGGSLLLVNAAGLALGAWCLRGHRRPKWIMLCGSLTVAAAALWAYFLIMGSDGEPVPVSRGKVGWHVPSGAREGI